MTDYTFDDDKILSGDVFEETEPSPTTDNSEQLEALKVAKLLLTEALVAMEVDDGDAGRNNALSWNVSR